MHEWLSGGVSPCQGEGRGFESRLVLCYIRKGCPIGYPFSYVIEHCVLKEIPAESVRSLRGLASSSVGAKQHEGIIAIGAVLNDANSYVIIFVCVEVDVMSKCWAFR